MIPVLFALSIMVWMWGAAMRHAVVRLAGAASPSQQRVYLAMAITAGAIVLVVVLAKMMPVSLLSAGWSQERLADLVRNAAIIAAVVAALALWRAHYLLPSLIVVGKKTSVSSASPNKKKRQ